VREGAKRGRVEILCPIVGKRVRVPLMEREFVPIFHYDTERPVKGIVYRVAKYGKVYIFLPATTVPTALPKKPHKFRLSDCLRCDLKMVCVEGDDVAWTHHAVLALSAEPVAYIPELKRGDVRVVIPKVVQRDLSYRTLVGKEAYASLAHAGSLAAGGKVWIVKNCPSRRPEVNEVVVAEVIQEKPSVVIARFIRFVLFKPLLDKYGAGDIEAVEEWLRREARK